MSWAYLERVLPLYDAITVPTSYLREKLQARGYAYVTVISNGVDTEQMRYDAMARDQFIATHNLSDFVLSISRLDDPRKDIATILTLARRLPEHTFVIIGGIRPFSPLSYRYKRHFFRTAPPNVHFLGYQSMDMVRGAYAAARCVLHPSWAETEGLVILEALACGTPVIARDLPAYRDFLVHGQNALLGDSVSALQHAINRVMNDDTLTAQLSSHGRATAATRDIRHVVRQYRDLYHTTSNYL